MSQAPLFEYSFQVPFHEVDRAGVMFFAHLFTHAHDAYERWMAHLGIGLDRPWTAMTYALPIAHAEADYRAPFHHGMKVRITLTIARLGRTSFTTAYAFIGPEDRLHARLQLVHGCIDPATGLKQALPDALRSRLVLMIQ